MDANGPAGGHTASAGPSQMPASNDSGAAAAIKIENRNNASPTAPAELSSEREIATALFALQEMESKIHQLRSLVPARLLTPLMPIVNPKVAPSMPPPKSPQEMFEQLAQAARDGVAEVEAFKAEWRKPEMNAIWERVDKALEESGGDFPQPSTGWVRDYRRTLKQLDEEEKNQEEQRRRLEEQQEKVRLAALEGGWKDIVESFMQMDIPGVAVQLLPSSTADLVRFSVALTKVSIMLYVQQANQVGTQDIGDWQVMIVPFDGKSTKLEMDILNCINSRDRKWDLPYLLDMISSYAEVRRTRCTTCQQLTDINAQLPTLRKAIRIDSGDGKKTFHWKPYHPGCL
ncbi:hypothetical protein AJ80_01261 [Polytolypa hystricis UAMH7299]|uniref:Mediator complex subunit 27 n=1 Tax=Polytolypa hystricis (strain UAMH7299) TaxID=1447883 RepID=A0A2B7Z0F2_POLH7|nr:hypothetical protein AJ80_01261 [Polytolypa hystricis UAMH7299]